MLQWIFVALHQPLRSMVRHHPLRREQTPDVGAGRICPWFLRHLWPRWISLPDHRLLGTWVWADHCLGWSCHRYQLAIVRWTTAVSQRSVRQTACRGGTVWLTTAPIRSWLTLCCSQIFIMLVFINYSAILPILKIEWKMNNTQAGVIFFRLSIRVYCLRSPAQHPVWPA